MVQTKAAERNHIRTCGDRFTVALAATTMIVRRDARLTGLDKIRQPLAFQAALKATGLESARYVPPPLPPGPPTDIYEVVADIFDRAVDAGRAAWRT